MMQKKRLRQVFCLNERDLRFANIFAYSLNTISSGWNLQVFEPQQVGRGM